MKSLEARHYVAGFMFSPDWTNVLLIRKNRPDFQAGRLNAIGGALEIGEAPYQAMVREFEEECGLKTSKSMWTKFHSEEFRSSGHTVHFMYSVSADLVNAETKTDEAVVLYDLTVNKNADKLLYNLPYLILMAGAYDRHPEHRWITW